MDGELYDEFGNYIGPEIESDSEGSSDEEQHQVQVRYYSNPQVPVRYYNNPQVQVTIAIQNPQVQVRYNNNPQV